MKIDVIIHLGVMSTVGVTSKSIWGDASRIGVGGSELGLLTMCEEWHKAGYDVTLYNNPSEPDASIFPQKPINSFSPQADRDVLVVFRAPDPRAVVAKGLKVWWSCDQQTVGDYRNFAPYVDKIVCISPFHQKYFRDVYGIEDTIVIDLPVRTQDYDEELGDHIIGNKVPYRLIFNSVPARGLDNAYRQYKLIKKEVPQTSITITSDYRLWGSGAGNEQFRTKWGALEDVIFLGAVPRKRLIQEQLQSQIHLYPCNYDELFCISVAENEYAGAYPVTSPVGAVSTTNMGSVIGLDPNDSHNDQVYADEVIKLLSDQEELFKKQYDLKKLAYEKFRPEVILKQWNEKVFNK